MSFGLFDTTGFPARWHCGSWTEAHGWTHIVSDLAIFGAYMAIPCVLAYFVMRRRDVPFLPAFWLFAAFILSCGIGHLVEATIFWHPWYRLSGLVKVCTALVSWATVIALVPMLPRALRLPGLTDINQRLGLEIEERLRVQRVLQAREEHFRVLFEAGVAKVIINCEGMIDLVNREAERLFGYDRRELLGQPVEILIPGRYRTHHPELRRGFLERPEARPMGAGRELFAVRKDGSEFPVEIGLSPIETSEGRFVLSSIVDITERKRLEGRFHVAMESAPLPLVMIDRSGVIVLINRETEKVFGYERNELLGHPIEVLVPVRSRPGHPKLRDGFFVRPESRRMGAGRDLYGVCKDGREIPVEIGLNPIEAADGPFVLSAIVDISERKRLEDEMRRMNEILEERVHQRTEELEHSNQALERSNLDLQQFAYIASHDLQSPLRAIAGFVQLLQRRCAGQLDEQAQKWIGSTIEATERMQRLITDLLDFSRVDTSARPFEPVPMNDVFRDTVAFLESAVHDSGGDVTRDELPVVSGDRTQLIQLLQNLISNGLKYRRSDPPKVHVSARRDGGDWAITVSDNGIGIDPRYHERIFDLFRRLHTQQQYPGTGIGLAVCRRVVQRHGGRIRVESSPGHGSQFIFTLPEAGGAQP